VEGLCQRLGAINLQRSSDKPYVSSSVCGHVNIVTPAAQYAV